MRPALERLDFRLPEFLRVVWVSQAARDHWEPKLRAVSEVWPTVERATVTHGMRAGALQSIAPDELPEIQRRCLHNHVPLVIVGMDGAHEAYGNAAIPYRAGEAFTYRVYVGADPEGFLAAWQDQDNLAIGEALGFPRCCAAFFDRYWHKEGWRDLTGPAIDEPVVPNQAYNNVLLRHVGVRLVFHLPCAFSCTASAAIGRDVVTIMRELGLHQEAAWATELLSMPMTWSSLHGVAIVTTPLFKLVYASDALPRKVSVQLQSERYPEFSGRGTTAPFLAAHPLTLVQKPRPVYLNGFSTLETMQQAHRFLVSALPTTDLVGRIVDLGCGDGALLQAIRAQHPRATLHGVEADTRIKLVDPELRVGDEYWRVDLFSWRWELRYRLALLAIQRLTEAGPNTVTQLLDRIARQADQLLLYSYAGGLASVADVLADRFEVVSMSVAGSFEAAVLTPRGTRDHDHIGGVAAGEGSGEGRGGSEPLDAGGV